MDAGRGTSREARDKNCSTPAASSRLLSVFRDRRLSQSFDGTYLGVSPESSARGRDSCNRAGVVHAACCPFISGVPVPLVISGRIVHSTAWQGAVDAGGRLVIQNARADRVDATIGSDGFIRGQYSGQACVVSFVWRKG
jgi:hypothetical protein